jgi:hypothetical protein
MDQVSFWSAHDDVYSRHAQYPGIRNSAKQTWAEQNRSHVKRFARSAFQKFHLDAAKETQLGRVRKPRPPD